jgi:hypothetical protein
MAARIPGFIPEELRQLARFVPLRGWDVIDWKPMLGSLRTVSWRFVSGSGVKGLRAEVSKLSAPVTLAASLDDVTPLAEVHDERRLRHIGDEILRLYFSQWLVPEGLFIDLRAVHFGAVENVLVYAPNGLWVRLRPEFRQGMLALYRSFYSADEQAFDAALRQMGMVNEGLSAAAEKELKALLFQHFGIDQSEQRFSIDAFKASFDELFGFFIAHGYKLHSDFVWVGFYLITLYLTLEQGGAAHDTRKICEDTLIRGHVR